MNRAFHAIDDRVLWQAIIQQNYPRAHTGHATVAYRARLANFYNAIGETPPENVKAGQIEAIVAALTAWEAAGHPSLRRRSTVGRRGSAPREWNTGPEGTSREAPGGSG